MSVAPTFSKRSIINDDSFVLTRAETATAIDMPRKPMISKNTTHLRRVEHLPSPSSKAETVGALLPGVTFTASASKALETLY